MKIPKIYQAEFPDEIENIACNSMCVIYRKIGNLVKNERREWFVSVRDIEEGMEPFVFSFGSKDDFDIKRWETDETYYPKVLTDGMPMYVLNERGYYYHGIAPTRKGVTEFDGVVHISAGWLEKDTFKFSKDLCMAVLDAYKESLSDVNLGVLWDEKPFIK